MCKNKFNVLTWNFNRDELEYYDVLPYFRDCYNKVVEFNKKNKSNNNSDWWKVPKTLNEFKEFIEQKSQYQFWSRCEYEMICHGWPIHKNNYKLDVHEQVIMNIDIIAEILCKETLLKSIPNHENISNRHN